MKKYVIFMFPPTRISHVVYPYQNISPANLKSSDQIIYSNRALPKCHNSMESVLLMISLAIFFIYLQHWKHV